MLANMESRHPSQEWEVASDTVSVVRNSDSCDACPRGATEDHNSDDQDLQGISMVWQGSGKWWKLCGCLGNSVLSQVGGRIRHSGPTVAQYSTSSALVVAAEIG